MKVTAATTKGLDGGKEGGRRSCTEEASTACGQDSRVTGWRDRGVVLSKLENSVALDEKLNQVQLD